MAIGIHTFRDSFKVGILRYSHLKILIPDTYKYKENGQYSACNHYHMETLSKRAKMDDSNDDLGNIPNKTYTTPMRKVDTCNSDLKNLIETSSYVDKSLLIQTVLDNGPMGILITAPRRFGKSANLSMLKYFFEIQDKSPKLEKDWATPVTDTSNYDLFTKHEFKITKHSDIMCKHFGKYPVIHADFKCGNISSYEDAVAHCRAVVHDSFKQHEYLTESVMLEHSDKSICENWCSYMSYPEIDKSYVKDGLKTLSKYLYKHFNKKCIVLIDEYDAIITKAMFQVADAHVFSAIAEFTLGTVVSAALKSNDAYVERAFMTGISYIAGIGLSDGLNNIKAYKFLRNHKFVEFYGLTEAEVNTLLNNPIFNLDSNLVEKAHSQYNGYNITVCNRIGKMYSIWSVLNFIESNKVGGHWVDTGNVYNLQHALEYYSIRSKVEELLQDKSIRIIENKINVADLIVLRQHSKKEQIRKSDVDNYFLFLWELGYLTCEPTVEANNECIYLRIPNDEIKHEFRQYLGRFYYASIANFDSRNTKQCINLLENVSLETDEYEQDIKQFREILECLWKIFFDDTCLYINEASLRAILFSIICRARYYKFGTEQFCGNGRSDITVKQVRYEEEKVETLFSIIIEVTFKKSSRIGLEQIVTNKYYDLGDKHMHKCLLMGINRAEDLKVSISYLIVDPNAEDINVNNAKDI